MDTRFCQQVFPLRFEQRVDLFRESSDIRDLMNHPVLSEAIGADQALVWANQVAKLAGLPIPRPLRNEGVGKQDQQQQSKELLQGVIEQVMRNVKQGMEPVLDVVKSNEIKIDNLYRELKLPPPNANTDQSPADGPVQEEGQGVAAST